MRDRSLPRGGARRASPYSTGGGGTVLEHRYGALLLSHLLTADPLAELGDDVTPQEIAFQTSAFSAVDDLVVSGFSSVGTERRVSIGVRRGPLFIPSDESTVDLIGSYLQVIDDHWSEVSSGHWRLTLAVASPSTHVQQLRELASIARDVIDEIDFRGEVARHGRTTQGVRDRLVHFDGVVAAAARDAGIDTTAVSASELTWRLLGALRLRELRLEGIDETDRTLTVGRLRQVTAAGTADAADMLFSRLAELVGRYAPAAAIKNESSLRRDLSGTALVRPLAASTPVGGSVVRTAITGNNAGDIVVQAGPAVRSDYLSQVKRIAPQQLLGRERELAYLAVFCTTAGLRPYLWWRAGAWAGKSALLSSFVLDPPSGVRVVSFFITARWAGQSDRIAFADVVLEQVLEIIGEPMPTILTDATREAHLLGSLARAAGICQHRGERLVLVVDGLDEDQGVTTGPDAHSIAAMLPAHPPAGMRVVIAGRPNPPIPADVPDDHPLRDTEIIRALDVSPRAQVVRQDAERELKRLLHGTTAEQDLLGLLTAAGGGLSGTDLAELTSSSSWEIEDCLGAVSGRTFTPRAGHWRPNTIVYVLGHEELQQQATRFLGASRLEAYRHRLHNWADRYRGQKWPRDTPEYLLRGYYRLLHTIADISRMLVCATDPDRHDRMLDIIGGDTGALAEITMTQEAIASQAVPDLLAMSQLAVHRTKLTERNDNMPANLPGVWAQLGRSGRAEALARSITHQSRQVQALTAVVHEVAVSGDLRRAEILSIQAERTVLSVTDPYQQAHAYATVARAFAEAGNSHRADILISRAEVATRSLINPSRQAHVLVAIARAVATIGDSRRANSIALSIATWSERAQALGAVAAEVANSGDLRRARSIAFSISSRSERAQALAAIARAANVAGDQRRSVKIAGEAERIARSIKNPGRQAWTLVAVGHAIASAGEPKNAAAILLLAEQLASSITKLRDRDDTLTAIGRVTAIANDPDRAEMIARNISNPSRRAKAFAAVASGLAASGHQRRAEAIAGEAEKIARSITSPSHEAKALAALAQAVAAAGDLGRAEEIARSISDLSQQGRTLTVVTQAMATVGNFDRAETIAASISDPVQQSKAYALIVRAGIASGHLDHAEKIAQSIRDPAQRARALAILSRAAVSIRDSGRALMTGEPIADASSQSDALEKVVEAELNSGDLNCTRSVTDPYRQAKPLIAGAQVAAEAGDAERAETTINDIAHPQLRTRAFVSVSDVIASAGDLDGAQRFVDQALMVASSIASPALQDSTIAEIAPQFAKLGDPDRAVKIARAVTDSSLQEKALVAVALAVAASGKLDQAERIILSISDSSRRAKTLAARVEVGVSADNLKRAEAISRSIIDPLLQAKALSVVAQAFAAAGCLKEAENIARSIADFSKQAQALTDLAANLTSSEARHLLAHALTVGHWQICLAGLIRIEPDAVGVMAEEFLRATKHSRPSH